MIPNVSAVTVSTNVSSCTALNQISQILQPNRAVFRVQWAKQNVPLHVTSPCRDEGGGYLRFGRGGIQQIQDQSV